jgi:hypothetical protein
MNAKKMVATTATYSSAVRIQPESPRIRAAPAGTGMTPALMFRMVVHTKSGIMAAQTIMQNGQRMWME